MAVRRQLAVVSASLAFGLVALAGCQDEEPQPRLPEETTSSPSPSPTEAESTEAAQETPEEFIERWAAADTEMQNSGRTDEFRAISQSCASCLEVADRIDSIYAAGGVVETRGITIRRVTKPIRNGDLVTYQVLADSAPTRFRESASADWQELSGGTGRRYEITVQTDPVLGMVRFAVVDG